MTTPNGNGIAAPPPAHLSAASTSTNGASTTKTPAPAAPAPAPKPPASGIVSRDVRTYLPRFLHRFTGYRAPGAGPPFRPLPFPPFSWLRHVPLKYEVWLLSLIGAFVGIALIEAVMATAFKNQDMILIVASFGASAVLTYGTIESPLAQPPHLVGGQVISAIVGVAVTRLFRKATGYHLEDVTTDQTIHSVVWLNAALSMALALLAQQVTNTVHPPGGATAIIASATPAAVGMSWRYVYIVLISALLMLGWGMIINNIGRRRYPTYWLHGSKTFVRPPPAPPSRPASPEHPFPHSHAPQHALQKTQDEIAMAAVEGRGPGFAELARSLSWDAEKGERGLVGGGFERIEEEEERRRG